MLNSCEITVVIPTHNRRDGLIAALESLRRQTFKGFEVVVVNDASDFDVSAVTTLFDDLNIVLVNNEISLGGNASRNKGVAMSNGSYIAFLDDDDEFLENKIGYIRSWVEEQPDIDVFYHPAKINMVDQGKSYLSGARANKRDFSMQDELLAHNIVGGTSMVVCKKRAIVDAGLFDENLPALQDYEMWLRLAVNGSRFSFKNEVLTNYYNYSGAGSISKSHEKVRFAREYIEGKYSDLFSTMSPALRKDKEFRRAALDVRREHLSGSYYSAVKRSFILFFKFPGYKSLFIFLSSLLGAGFFSWCMSIAPRR